MVSKLFVLIILLVFTLTTCAKEIATSNYVIRNVDSYDDEPQPVAMAQSVPAPGNEHAQQSAPSAVPLQPDIKWISPSDFLELIRYLFDQAKNIPYTNFLIIDTRNSNEYNGWKSFDAIYAALDFNHTG